MEKLSDEQASLLHEVLEKRAPQRLELVMKARRAVLLDHERAELCEFISAEFLTTGLGVDDEPTPRGIELEQLLDEVNRPRLER